VGSVQNFGRLLCGRDPVSPVVSQVITSDQKRKSARQSTSFFSCWRFHWFTRVRDEFLMKCEANVSRDRRIDDSTLISEIVSGTG
jgi:hypothetical protein